jgi:hypothetical protein
MNVSKIVKNNGIVFSFKITNNEDESLPTSYYLCCDLSEKTRHKLWKAVVDSRKSVQGVFLDYVLSLVEKFPELAVVYVFTRNPETASSVAKYPQLYNLRNAFYKVLCHIKRKKYIGHIDEITWKYGNERDCITLS